MIDISEYGNACVVKKWKSVILKRFAQPPGVKMTFDENIGLGKLRVDIMPFLK